MIEYENNENTMLDIMDKIESFTIFKNGQAKEVDKTQPSFLNIKKNLGKVLESALVMPAYSVSLHEETVKAMSEGNWLQINMKKQTTKNGLPFNALLFKLDETYGIDLIRFFNNQYDGRCIHLSLNEQIDLNKIIY